MWKMLVGRMGVYGESSEDEGWPDSSHVSIPASEGAGSGARLPGPSYSPSEPVTQLPFPSISLSVKMGKIMESRHGAVVRMK